MNRGQVRACGVAHGDKQAGSGDIFPKARRWNAASKELEAPEPASALGRTAATCALASSTSPFADVRNKAEVLMLTWVGCRGL